MIISKKHKFIFIAVGRTGTTSIEKALRPFDEYVTMNCSVRYKDHAPISELEGQVELRKYYKFCFVRNPWDLAVSKYLCHNKPFLLFLANKSPFSKYFFQKWLNGTRTAKKYAYHNEKLSNLNTQYEYPLKDMHDFFLSSDGEIIMDDIFKYENIKSGFQKSLNKIGIKGVSLPHKNKAGKSWYGIEDYRTLYNEKSKNMVKRHFKRDISKFEYEF